MQILSIFIRTLVSFLALEILAKIIGARQISQLSYYDYISGITIGSIAATLAIDESIPMHLPLISIILYFVFTYLLSYITTKSLSLRKVLTGIPRILIYKNRIIEENLKKNHFDINDLLTECRTQGFFSIADIEYAIMETNGRISILPKSQNAPLVPKDMNIETTEAQLYANVIIDGKIMEEQLQTIGKNANWLHHQCQLQKAQPVENILLAIASNDNELHIYYKNEPLKNAHFFI